MWEAIGGFITQSKSRISVVNSSDHNICVGWEVPRVLGIGDEGNNHIIQPHYRQSLCWSYGDLHLITQYRTYTLTQLGRIANGLDEDCPGMLVEKNGDNYVVTFLDTSQSLPVHGHFPPGALGYPQGGVVNNIHNQQNVAGDAYGNNFQVRAALVEYDNKLLNDMDFLGAAIKEYGMSRTIDAVLNFDSNFIDEVVASHNEDLLLAGILSFEDYCE